MNKTTPNSAAILTEKVYLCIRRKNITDIMKDSIRQKEARRFVSEWTGRGYEKGESQTFWLSLLRDVLGVEHPESIISFEDKVHLDHTSFIDGYIRPTQVLIEQKGIGKDLRKPIRQSDGSMLTPFQQAKRYITELPRNMHPRWVVTCNFASFLVYDMENPSGEPEEIRLEDIPDELYRLRFLVDPADMHVHKETEVSLKAGEIVSRLYDAILQQYRNPTAADTLRSLNMLCVRLVFCLYAEDAGLFGRHGLFHDYMTQFAPERMRKALQELFDVLNTPTAARDPYMEDNLLAAFPYVNGGLFADTAIEIPSFNDEIAALLLTHASDDFDWSGISPTIFGAVFESTLNPETRRKGGMHYTSVDNIHKVIDPLFLDSLRADFNEISRIRTERRRRQLAEAFRDKLAGLTFLDPACGSGNFLTETYLSLRRLENECLRLIHADGQILLGGGFSPVKVSIGQFYGIEVNDFAVSVARTALWIAEAQMMKETETIVGRDLDYLPLKAYPNIMEGNALATPWENIKPDGPVSYIMGNPPFIGNNQMSPSQRKDILPFFLKNKTVDYVGAWFYKAAEYMNEADTRAALVATNSITQGEQVAILWKPLYDKFHIHIDFAHSTFKWDNDASQKAQVHCVIVGFSNSGSGARLLFDKDGMRCAANINAYLLDGPDIFIESRSKPLCDVPYMSRGNQPTDGGNLIIEASDYDAFVKKEPKALKYIKKLVGAKEFINNLPRYCLWLVGASPSELRQMPSVMERVSKCREMRLNSPDAGTRRLADTPALFRETNNPATFVVIPRVSSEHREYVPIGFMTSDTIVTDSVHIIPNATLYHFGVLTSRVHMAWMRTVCGRLKSDYRYSKDIVYNNFPWPTPTEAQRQRIESAAQAILDARAMYPDSSLADLYDTVTMPPELRKAHRQNDMTVASAYGFAPETSEEDIVARLFIMYAEMTRQ